MQTANQSLASLYQKRLITLALEQTQYNRTQAAEMLSVWRPYLFRRIAALEIKEP